MRGLWGAGRGAHGGKRAAGEPSSETLEAGTQAAAVWWQGMRARHTHAPCSAGHVRAEPAQRLMVHDGSRGRVRRQGAQRVRLGRAGGLPQHFGERHSQARRTYGACVAVGRRYRSQGLGSGGVWEAACLGSCLCIATSMRMLDPQPASRCLRSRAAPGIDIGIRGTLPSGVSVLASRCSDPTPKRTSRHHTTGFVVS